MALQRWPRFGSSFQVWIQDLQRGDYSPDALKAALTARAASKEVVRCLDALLKHIWDLLGSSAEYIIGLMIAA